jgi:hypothetical protein
MGQSSDRQYQSLVFGFLGFRGWSAALLGSRFFISSSYLDRGLVCASAPWPIDHVVAVRRRVGGGVGSVDFGVVLDERPIMLSAESFPEHLRL